MLLTYLSRAGAHYPSPSRTGVLRSPRGARACRSVRREGSLTCGICAALMGLTQHYARVLGFRFIRREQPVDHLVADTEKLTREGPGSVPALESAALTYMPVTLSFPNVPSHLLSPEPCQTLEVRSAGDLHASQRRGALEGDRWRSPQQRSRLVSHSLPCCLPRTCPPPGRGEAQLSVKYAFVFLALTAASQEHLVPLGRGDQLVPQCVHRPGGRLGLAQTLAKGTKQKQEFAQGSPEGTGLQVLVLPSEACFPDVSSLGAKTRFSCTARDVCVKKKS